jgi:hypothetical protein
MMRDKISFKFAHIHYFSFLFLIIYFKKICTLKFEFKLYIIAFDEHTRPPPQLKEGRFECPGGRGTEFNN